MRKFEALQQLLESHISKQNFPAEPVALYEPVRYLLSLGGKRMRPSLLLASCEMFNGEIESCLDAALAIELFHNFTLIHDDIMDQADSRRGKPTVHTKWNTNTAILSGDVMLVIAYQYLIRNPHKKIDEMLRLFNETAIQVCEGQQYDMQLEDQPDVSETEYLEMIEKKTAVLLAASLKMGAMLANASAEDAMLIYEFGKHIGIAFQLQDDWLDAFGDPAKTGKQPGGDIVRNKKTFLLIKAMALANAEQKAELMKWLSADQFNKEEKVSAVRKIYEALDLSSFHQQEMKRHYDTALSQLDKISLPAEKKTVIASLPERVIERQG